MKGIKIWNSEVNKKDTYYLYLQSIIYYSFNSSNGTHIFVKSLSTLSTKG